MSNWSQPRVFSYNIKSFGQTRLVKIIEKGKLHQLDFLIFS
jgi:hypothetical protein